MVGSASCLSFGLILNTDGRVSLAEQSTSIVRFLDDNEVREAALHLLSNRGFPPDLSRIKIVMPALIELVRSRDDEDALRFACDTFRNFCWSDDGARSLALGFGAVPSLICLLSHSRTEVIAMAASALSKICAYKPAAVTAQKENSVHKVVCLLESNDTEVQKSAAFLLSNLCFASKLALVDALESNSIQFLVHLLRSSQNDVRTAAVKALMNITVDERAGGHYSQENTIRALVELVKSGDSEEISLRYACGVLRNICWWNDNARFLALHLGVVPLLIRLLWHNNTQVIAMSTSALSQICAYDRAAVAAQTPGIIPRIIRLLAFKETEVQESAAILLSRLCLASKAARDAALKLKARDTLLRLFQSDNGHVRAAGAEAWKNVVRM
jgi:hypothetical protein